MSLEQYIKTFERHAKQCEERALAETESEAFCAFFRGSAKAYKNCAAILSETKDEGGAKIVRRDRARRLREFSGE